MTLGIRKDSGISIKDETIDATTLPRKRSIHAMTKEDAFNPSSPPTSPSPIHKKQRVPSADHTLKYRRLPHLSPPPSFGAVPLSCSQSSETLSSVHPLDAYQKRRASTAPSSPCLRPPHHSPKQSIQLPALASITAAIDTDPLSLQLAPLQSTASSPVLPPPPPSSPSVMAYHRHSIAAFHPQAPAPSTPRHLSYPQLHSHTLSSKPRMAKQVGQFLCEYIIDPTTNQQCGQTFRRSYDLSRHQTIHLKNRPFCYCHQCGKKFTRMDALRRHERVQGHSSHLLHPPSPVSSRVPFPLPNSPYSTPQARVASIS
ncbi:hypothetical protein DM01DRAFT_1381854 [Hesseltinella vesiculosa]|uniref:C2H2-type domain-containing protein n=1 Tax=Hesseltinella vesiculosa TaxID=101127 RepID=A0A1X2GP83_9FUNG|nr:hypothetical protein DM01DRAFT_1381854 [Hesseltinella vesiculosa]